MAEKHENLTSRQGAKMKLNNPTVQISEGSFITQKDLGMCRKEQVHSFC